MPQCGGAWGEKSVGAAGQGVRKPPGRRYGTVEVIYRYDGSFEGFLCCVFDSYVNKELPAEFQDEAHLEASLFPARWVGTDLRHAQRILVSLEKIDPWAQELVVKGFLTCAPDREMLLYRFIRALYSVGKPLLRRLSDDAVLPLLQAVRHLDGEVHLLKGFVRFSEFEGMLAGEIRPKNRVLPLLRRHFCSRFYNETFLLYDRTHREALVHQNGKWAIMPLDSFKMAAPSAAEAQYRRLWKRFYDTIEIKERHNPKLRRTHMPQRYWDTMTEFQGEDYFTAVEPPAPAVGPAVGGASAPLLPTPAAPPSPTPGP